MASTATASIYDTSIFEHGQQFRSVVKRLAPSGTHGGMRLAPTIIGSWQLPKLDGAR